LTSGKYYFIPRLITRFFANKPSSSLNYSTTQNVYNWVISLEFYENDGTGFSPIFDYSYDQHVIGFQFSSYSLYTHVG